MCVYIHKIYILKVIYSVNWSVQYLTNCDLQRYICESQKQPETEFGGFRLSTVY